VYKSQSMSFANTNTIEHAYATAACLSVRGEQKYAKEIALKKFD